MTYDDWKTHDPSFDERCDEEREEEPETDPCPSCHAEWDHEPDCTLAGQLLQEAEEARAVDLAEAAAALASEMEAFIDGSSTMARVKVALRAYTTARDGVQ